MDKVRDFGGCQGVGGRDCQPYAVACVGNAGNAPERGPFGIEHHVELAHGADRDRALPGVEYDVRLPVCLHEPLHAGNGAVLHAEHPDTQRALQASCPRADRRCCAIEFPQGLFGAFQEELAAVVQMQAFPQTVEQLHAQFVFELCEGLRKRWLGEVQHCGRLRDAFQLRHANEVFELVNLHATPLGRNDA